MRTPTTCLAVIECEFYFEKPLDRNLELKCLKSRKCRHIGAKNGQSHQHPTFARGSARPAHWLDYRIREGDECLAAGTDFARSLGMAFAVTGRCSDEC